MLEKFYIVSFLRGKSHALILESLAEKEEEEGEGIGGVKDVIKYRQIVSDIKEKQNKGNFTAFDFQ